MKTRGRGQQGGQKFGKPKNGTPSGEGELIAARDVSCLKDSSKKQLDSRNSHKIGSRRSLYRHPIHVR